MKNPKTKVAMKEILRKTARSYGTLWAAMEKLKIESFGVPGSRVRYFGPRNAARLVIHLNGMGRRQTKKNDHKRIPDGRQLKLPLPREARTAFSAQHADARPFLPKRAGKAASLEPAERAKELFKELGDLLRIDGSEIVSLKVRTTTTIEHEYFPADWEKLLA